MRSRAAFRQVDLTRALKAAALAGLKVQRFEIETDGRIVVVTGEPEPIPRDYLAEWQTKRVLRKDKAVPAIKGWDDVVGR